MISSNMVLFLKGLQAYNVSVMMVSQTAFMKEIIFYSLYNLIYCSIYQAADPGISEPVAQYCPGRILGIWGLFECIFTYIPYIL